MGTQFPSPDDLAEIIIKIVASIKNNVDNAEGLYENELFCAIARLNAENVTKEHWR